MGFFVPDEQPVIWRGPMLHKALEQFLVDAYWGEPDFLLIDMPPGHRRRHPLAGPVPAPDRDRGGHDATGRRPAGGPALGLRGQEAQAARCAASSRTCRGSPATTAPATSCSGRAAAQALADDLEVPLLGRIPLVPAVREGGDTGVPVRVRRSRRRGGAGLRRAGRPARRGARPGRGSTAASSAPRPALAGARRQPSTSVDAPGEPVAVPSEVRRRRWPWRSGRSSRPRRRPPRGPPRGCPRRGRRPLAPRG